MAGIEGAVQGLIDKWEPQTPEGTRYEAELQSVIREYAEAPIEPQLPPGGPGLEEGMPPQPPVDREAYGSGPFTKAEKKQGYKKRPCVYK